MNLQFENLWILLLLWILPLTGFWWYSAAKRREKKLAEFISHGMQARLRPPESFRRLAWQTGLVIGGLSLSIIAAARPQWGTKEQTVFQRGRDLVIALDVSRSMLAEDVHPNRLKRAKTDIRDIVKELRGDRAALIAFRYKALLLCPLTTDYAYFNYALDAVDIDSAPRGETDIGDAITKAMEAFEDESGSHKAIILISDGEDLTGRAIETAKKAGEKGIPIFTVGIGDPNGSQIPVENMPGSYLKHEGKEVKTRLDNNTLYEIARASGGAYIPAQTAAMDLGTIYSNHLRKISEQDMEETLKRLNIERYQIFLLPALLLLIAAGCLSQGRLGKTVSAPKLKQLVIIISFSILALNAKAQAPDEDILNIDPDTQPATTTTNSAQPTQASDVNPQPSDIIPPGREGARMAQKEYQMGNYEKAAGTYLQAARESTAKSQRDFKYNAAASYFKAGKYAEAADIFRELDLTTTVIDSPVASGLGSSVYRQAKAVEQSEGGEPESVAKLLKEAGESFRKSARGENADRETLQNLAVVLDQLPEAEEKALIDSLVKKHQQTSAPELTAQMLNNQRDIETEMKKAFANDDPAQIAQLEQLAKRQKENSQLWIPLKGKLLEAMAQQEQGQDPQKMAAMSQNIEMLRDNMVTASEELRNIDTGSQDSVYASKMAIYRMWKSIADYQALLQEDMHLQSNIIQNTSAQLPDQPVMEAAQAEASDLTKLFTERFTKAVPEGGSEPPPAPPTDTNTVSTNSSAAAEQQGISAADRAKILDLAGQASTSQESALKLIKEGKLAESLPEQQKSYDLLKEINELLPKDKKQNQQQDQSQPKNQEQNQEQKQEQDNQDQKQEQNQQQPPEEQPQENKPEQQEEDKQDDQTPEDIKKLLEKALQREKEHEAEKRKRNRSIPLSPRERDW